MPGEPKKDSGDVLPVESGNRAVRDWLLSLDPLDRKSVGVDVVRMEYGWPIGMPTCCPLGDGLWEVRSKSSGDRIARVLFCIVDGRMVLLHSFIKETQKTPESDLKLARSRTKDGYQ